MNEQGPAHLYVMTRADGAAKVGFLADLDDLRVAERPVLSRAEYLRKLVTEAKKREGKRK